MSKKPPIHVVPTGDGWATIREGGTNHTNRSNTQREAIDAGRAQARRDGTELLIHGRDNLIRARDSYGNDPYPPQG